MWYEILLINILSASMGGAIIYYFCNINYGTKKSIPRIIAFVFSFGVVNGFLSILLMQGGDLLSTIRPIILLMTSITIIQILLNTKFYQSIISFVIYSICVGIGSVIVPIIPNISSTNITPNSMLMDPFFLLLANALANLIAYIIMFFIKPLKTFTSKLSVQKSLLPILIFTFIILAVNFGLHIYSKIYNLSSFLITLFPTFFYCFYLLIISKRLLKNEAAKLEIEQQKFYNDSLNSTLFNLRRFKHDWSNNLAVINSMLSMGKITELKQYMSELINQSNEGVNTAIYNIKNAGLFGIISSKLNHAQDIGVNVDFSVIGEVENIAEIKISELCEVVGIFIDNAIEESLNVEKEISLNIYSDEKYLEISIANSCLNEPDMKKIYEAGYSSKGDGRGMGLAIARKITNKYKNIQNVSDFDNNTFTQTITIEKGL